MYAALNDLLVIENENWKTLVFALEGEAVIYSKILGPWKFTSVVVH